MNPQVFGNEHIIYLVLSTVIGAVSLILIKKYAKSERAKAISLKCIAFLLLAAIVANRLSQVFRYSEVRWYCIIPDSFCGMTSLVLALAVLLGRRDNIVLHFCWLLGLFGGIATVIYPTFVAQHPSIFYLPTFSGLLHHSLSAMTAVAALMLGYIRVTYKKWYAPVLGLTCYMTVGAFLMSVFDMSDAFHIAEPLLDGTPLTAWVMGPMYFLGHGAVFLFIELIRHRAGVRRDKLSERAENSLV